MSPKEMARRSKQKTIITWVIAVGLLAPFATGFILKQTVWANDPTGTIGIIKNDDGSTAGIIFLPGSEPSDLAGVKEAKDIEVVELPCTKHEWNGTCLEVDLSSVAQPPTL